MQYETTVTTGGFGVTCPACQGTFQSKHKRKGVETATEICPHCKVKIETKYEPEEDSFWDTQQAKAVESGRDQMYLKMMQDLTGQDREDFVRGLHKLGIPNPVATAELRASWKRLRPNATETEIDIMVSGK